MPTLTAGALEELESSDEDVVRNALILLEEVIGVNCIRGFHSDIPEAQEEVLEAESLLEVKAALQAWIENHPNHPCADTAFWALGKFFDDGLTPFFEKWLQHYVDQAVASTHPLGQVLIALDNLGKPAISEGSFFAGDHGKNLNDALKYLGSRRTNRA